MNEQSTSSTKAADTPSGLWTLELSAMKSKLTILHKVLFITKMHISFSEDPLNFNVIVYKWFFFRWQCLSIQNWSKLKQKGSVHSREDCSSGRSKEYRYHPYASTKNAFGLFSCNENILHWGCQQLKDRKQFPWNQQLSFSCYST